MRPWPAPAAALTEAENANHDPEYLQHSARLRTLDDARSTAGTLTWRIQRLAARRSPETGHEPPKPARPR
ncbi:hypothetical protein ACSNOH_27380 [Streptomyces sp. URMC 127]|uniref:hypothetical protein n=1 Tax=Streptomyces sp. URMC 127 TaxID=3423402 RepID=UPI003F1BBE18